MGQLGLGSRLAALIEVGQQENVLRRVAGMTRLADDDRATLDCLFKGSIVAIHVILHRSLNGMIRAGKLVSKTDLVIVKYFVGIQADVETVVC